MQILIHGSKTVAGKDIDQQIRTLNYYARVVADCISDIKLSREGKRLAYNLDFSLLCPVLFGRATPGQKDFLVQPKAAITELLDREVKEAGFEIVISGATVVEIYDQLFHILDVAHRHIPMLTSIYARRDIPSFRETIVSSERIRRDLSLLTDKGLDEAVRRPINKLLGYIDRRTLIGIGDVIPRKELDGFTDSKMFDRFVEQQRARRFNFERSGRDEENSMFHYKIDAANNCLTLAAAHYDKVFAPFVTPMPINIEQCTTDSVSLGRFYQTPLALLSIKRLKEQKYISDEISFLEQTFIEINDIIRELGEFSRVSDIPPGLAMRMMYLYDHKIRALSGEFSADSAGDAGLQIDEILGTVSDPRKLKERLLEVKGDVITGARLLEMQDTKFDIPYIDQFDFENDVVINKIRKTLGVKI